MTASEFIRQACSEIGSAVVQGLSSESKWLPAHLFYDAEGSRLFEEITKLPEYYLTRTERDILAANAGDILTEAGSNLSLLELGAGTAAKTSIIIRALLRRQMRVQFCPIDVSADAVEIARRRLSTEFPALKVLPIVADYTNGFGALPEMAGRKLVLYLGSSIGNFEPDAASAVLRKLHSHLNPGDCLLLGTDMAKSLSLLLPAYDDSRGVTAQFNKNMLARINRELGGHFDLETFRHIVEWNAAKSRIEIYLESTEDQNIAIDLLGLTIRFHAGERIHTENSYKYTPALVQATLAAGGFRVERTWNDSQRWFGVHLARVA